MSEQTQEPLGEEAEVPETPEVEVTTDVEAEKAPQEPSGEEKRNRFQERISEITRQRNEAQREVQDLQQRIEQLQQQKPEQRPRPKLADFDFDEDLYQEALDGWYADNNRQAAKAARLEELSSDLNFRQQRAAQAALQTYQERSQAFAAEHGDFLQVVTNPNLPFNQVMTQGVMNSERGPEMAYYLGKNPDIAGRIAMMDPYAALIEMGKIEAKLSTDVAPKTPAAPDPIKPIGDKAAVEKDPDKMSADEYRDFRMKQLSRK